MIKTANLFSQLLRQFPRDEFANAVWKHRTEYYAKGFDSWTHFVSMLFCQVARAESLREICHGLSTCAGKLVHLGVFKNPNKSTLSYANEHRSEALFRDLFWARLESFRQQGALGRGGKKFRFKFKLSILDSTTISLCLSLFPWAKFRRTKGGVKVHVLLEHGDFMPEFISITQAKQHDVKFARILKLIPGSMVVMDRGYNDYRLFAQWTDRGVFFVTRLKDNAEFHVLERLPLPQGKPNLLSDKLIRFTGIVSRKKCPHTMRRVEVWDPINQQKLVFLTNNLDLAASTIAAIYQQRWQIEVFFKTLKQNLKVKTFVGTSENALRIQIWTAMIALLLLKWLHFLSKAKWSLSNLIAMLRLNLFTYRDLLDWLDDPFDTPLLEPGAEQLALPLPVLGQPGAFKGTTSSQPVQKEASISSFKRPSWA